MIPLAVTSALRASSVSLALRHDAAAEQHVATATLGDVRPGEGRDASAREAALDALVYLAAMHDGRAQEGRNALAQLTADGADAARRARCAASIEAHAAHARDVRALRRMVAALWPETGAVEVSL